jgi:hypothetical protein
MNIRKKNDPEAQQLFPVQYKSLVRKIREGEEIEK